ncbi:hypothetical protein Avbf_11105 [Armadillidium vulgare]|nr:hypothetical protein Avbf_11105 [Armadillidium vulgare]
MFQGLFLVLCVVALTCEASPQFFRGGFGGGRQFGGFQRSFHRPVFRQPSFGFGGGFNRFGRFGGFSREGFGGNSFEFFGK